MHEEKVDTKARLLDAAEELFLSKGFDAVSIRELAAAAQVNVAAVNYHFQGKDNLVREVIKRRFTVQRDQILGALNEILERHPQQLPLDALIRSIASLHLREALSRRPGGTLMKLIVRELHQEDKESTSLFLREMVAPVFRAFSDALLRARPNLDQEQVNWILASVVGQIHHFVMRWHKSRALLAAQDESVEVLLQAFPALELPVDEYIEQVTDHITRFSTAAIDALYPEVAS